MSWIDKNHKEIIADRIWDEFISCLGDPNIFTYAEIEGIEDELEDDIGKYKKLFKKIVKNYILND